MRRPAIEDSRDARIRALETQLYRARVAIIHLAPEKFRDLLQSSYGCRTRRQTYDWVNKVAEAVIDEAAPSEPDYGFGRRAPCPLCGSVAQTTYSNNAGYTIPEGLRRHLVGFGNMAECDVMMAARALAQDVWDREFGPAEAAADAEKERDRVKRTQTEPTYVLEPGGEALLLNEGRWYKPRSTEDGQFSLTWAEQRLFSLGFEIVVNGLQRSYVKKQKLDGVDLAVYADPRAVGHLSFGVFSTTEVRGRLKVMRHHQFVVRDAWKNDLSAKVSTGVFEARRKI